MDFFLLFLLICFFGGAAIHRWSPRNRALAVLAVTFAVTFLYFFKDGLL